jgi:hypothetical protein
MPLQTAAGFLLFGWDSLGKLPRIGMSFGLAGAGKLQITAK